jgi:hypothetical protein
LETATVFDRISKAFDPSISLGANDERYVDNLTERGIEDLFELLQQPLDDDKRKLVFFSGVMGDGKTTILNQVQTLLEERQFLVAYGEADKLFDLNTVEYENVLLGVLTVVERALRGRLKVDLMQENKLLLAWQELSAILQRPVEFKELKLGLGPIGELTTEIKQTPEYRSIVRQRLRQAATPTFVQVVNKYLDRAAELVSDAKLNKIVVILDNFDRIRDLPTQRESSVDGKLFLSQASQLKELNCDVIFTVRLALIHEYMSFLNDTYMGLPVLVPMVPPRFRDGRTNSEGLKKLHEVIERRMSPLGVRVEQVFQDPGSIEQLCLASGGYHRGLLLLVRQGCAMARARLRRDPSSPQKFIPEDIAKVIERVAAQLKLSSLALGAELQSVARERSLASLTPATRAQLFQEQLIYQYYEAPNYWFKPNPLLALDGRDPAEKEVGDGG